jgi:hypothetical protein
MRFLPIVMLAGCATSGTGAEDSVTDDSSSSYADLETRLTGDDVNRWIAARSQLFVDFDQLCGDTFCEGDYSNLSSASLHCSATTAGTIKECAWALGGSIEYVDGAHGTFTIDARTVACTIPVHTKIKPFLAALEQGTGTSIERPIPGTGRSFYDSLGDCLSGIVGMPPPSPTGTRFGEMADVAGTDAWFALRDQLRDEFDANCDDTFCRGTYTGIAALRFVCAVDTTTTNVPACRFDLVGAYDTVTRSTGHVTAHAKSFSCAVPVGATVAALTAALTGADPLHAHLPGKTTSINDVLKTCLL